MAHKTEVEFRDLQLDEQYKKLERVLKLAKLKRENRKDEDESWPLSISPSISRIHMDTFDSNTNIPPLQTSRVTSEIVSSSNKLRNMLLEKAYTNSNRKVITTSSVKKFDKKVDCQKNGVESLETSSDNLEDRRVRIVSKWTIALNEQGRLIVKGILKCGQFARSKPIIRRLTITRVESISKHLYHLEGNIVDTDYKLPDYVRGKFFSGFPDDWEDVYTIWMTFLQQGCRVTFRWPIPVADSDDDLRSEVTDITYITSKSLEDKELDSKFFEESRTSRSPLKDTQNSSSQRNKVSESFTQTCTSTADIKAIIHNTDSGTSVNQYSNDKENCPQQENADENTFFIERKADKLKDKLNVILNNLADKNCPQECISKMVQIVDCLNYVVSYGSVKVDDPSTECLRSEQDNCTIQEQSNKTCSICKSRLTESIPLQNSIDSCKDNYENKTVNHKYFSSARTEHHIMTDNKQIESDRSFKRKRTFTDVKRNMGKDSSDNESEIYAGIPKISVERLLGQKRRVIEPCKRKIRRTFMNQAYDTMEVQHSSNVPSVKALAETPTSEDLRSTNLSDFSTSIRPGESEFPNVKSEVQENFEYFGYNNIHSGNVDSRSLQKSVQGDPKVSKSTKNKKDCKPKSLSAWVPKVVREPDLQLIFEGQLLNDAGHVVLRKFKTDPVLRRISAKLIETIRHELYKLVDDLNDTKHVVPKKLISQCRNGCPVRIEQFCEEWEHLQTGTVEVPDDMSAGNVTGAVSSRCRRSTSPLSYSIGDGIVYKDNNPLYSRGSSLDSLTLPSNESPSKVKHVKMTKGRSKNTGMKSSLDEPEVSTVTGEYNSTTASVPEKSFNTKTPNLRQLRSNKHKELVIRNERRAVRETLGSSDSSDIDSVPPQKRRRIKRNQQKSPIHIDKRNKRDDQSLHVGNAHQPYQHFDGNKFERRSTRLEGRGSAKLNAPPSKPIVYSSGSENQQPSLGKNCGIVCTYYQDIPYEGDMLSEDAISHV